MQSHQLDQLADVRLRVAERQRAAVGPQALREAGQVDHQRRVREAQLGQVDDDVAGRPQRRRDGTPTAPAGGAVLVPGYAQDPELFVEGDDGREPRQTGG